MLTWLMGAWLVYHLIAGFHYYFDGAASATPATLEAFFHHNLFEINIGHMLGTPGPALVVTWGMIVTFVVLIALNMEMARTVRYAFDKNFSGSQFDLYGSILLLVVCCVESFFVPLVQTSLFMVLIFATLVDVIVHVRFLHFSVRGRKAA
jgi:hypothetical protein